MELLSNIDLENIAKALRIPLKHIGFKDTFTMKPIDGAYIVNLQSSVGNTGGSHWTGLVLQGGQAVYFDPFGMPVPLLIRKFIFRYKPKRAIYSMNQIQALPSILCGYFTLYFLFYLTSHNTSNRLGWLLNRHNAIYRTEEDTDRIVQRLFRKLFS